MKYGTIARKDSAVFMFHQVTNDKNKWKDTNCAITLTNFEKFIGSIEQLDIAFGSIEELQNSIQERRAYITFDDIYADAVDNAFPLLIEKKIPFCVFISTNLIDREGYVSTKQLKKLETEELCTIGFHTNSHLILRTLKKDLALNEIKKDKFEKKLNRSIEYFAYPFGSYYAVSMKNRRMVRAEKYKVAFSTLKMPLNEKIRKKFNDFIPRININNNNYESILQKIKR